MVVSRGDTSVMVVIDDVEAAMARCRTGAPDSIQLFFWCGWMIEIRVQASR